MAEKKKGVAVKEVTAVNDLVLEVNTSEKACRKFGFSSNQRIIDTFGRAGTIIGIAPVPTIPGPPCIEPGTDVLWVSMDVHGGKVCFISRPLTSLKPLKMH